MASSTTRVVVIGAGWNGLAAAKTYLQVDPAIHLTVLESEESLGGTWCAERVYPGLLNQAPYSLYEATDFPMEQRDPDQPGGGVPSERIHSYLKEYAKKFNIADKIRYNTTVERVRRAVNGGGWEVFIEGESQPIICDKLIVATGHTSRANIPNVPTSNFTPFTFHAKYLGKHFDIMKEDNKEVQTISVYGGGKSAYEAANAAVAAGKKVNWIIRKSGEGPGMFIDITKAKVNKRAIEFALSRAGGSLQPDPFSQGWSYRFFHSGQNAFGYWLCWMFWGLATKFMYRKYKYDSNPTMKKLKPEYLDHALFWAIPVPTPIQNPLLLEKLRAEDENVKVYRADITQLSDRHIHLDDGTKVETDVLIYATGYTAHQTIFSEEDAYDLGLPIPMDRLLELEAKSKTTDEPGTSVYLKRMEEMNKETLKRFPRLADCPSKSTKIKTTEASGSSNGAENATTGDRDSSNPKLHHKQQSQYRLYRSILPLRSIQKEDRSLAFVGYLHGGGLTLTADISSLWAVAWLSGQLDIKREMKDIEWEVDYLNAFTRLRFGSRWREVPVSRENTYSMLDDLGLYYPNLGTFTPRPPRVYNGLIEKWKAEKGKKIASVQIGESTRGV